MGDVLRRTFDEVRMTAQQVLRMWHACSCTAMAPSHARVGALTHFSPPFDAAPLLPTSAPPQRHQSLSPSHNVLLILNFLLNTLPWCPFAGCGGREPAG